MSTLSTTQSDSTTAEPDRNTPVTLDGDPVIWDGNHATLKGILEEVKLFYVGLGLPDLKVSMPKASAPFDRQLADTYRHATVGQVAPSGLPRCHTTC